MREMKESQNQRIGAIPREWQIRKIKNVAVLYAGNSIKDEEKEFYEDPIDAIPYLSSKDIDAKLHIADYDNGMYVKSNDSAFKVAPTGSSLMCIEGGSAGRKKTYLTKDVAFVNKLCCFKPVGIDSRFLFQWICSPNFEDEFRQNVAGLIGGVSVSSLQNFAIVIPSRTEQKLVAEFLNLKCDEINQTISDTEKTIEEYKTLKQAIVTQAVTHGIRGHRSMKDSGIEWIGKIPEDWEIRRIKTLFNLRDERNYSPLDEVNLISLYTDLGVIQHNDLEKTTGNKASNADGYKKVYENDIIVNIILCWMGAIGRSDYAGVTSPAYDVYIPKENVDSRFYHYYFRTSGFSGDCYKRGKGIMAMRWRTYSDQFMDIKVAYPPIDEQNEILSYLDTKCAEIDRLISTKQRLLDEILNYKKSLIYEYVTGKKEVI